MSDIAYTLLGRYAKLREQHLRERPEKRLMPTLFRGTEKAIKLTTETIKPGPEAGKIAGKGLLILAVIVALLVASMD